MSRTLSIIGIALTIVYLGALWFLFDGRLVEIMLMKPNEIGDLLAGAFGPLAILWLILGFFQQGIELRQNTKALELQAEELRKSVEHQKEMVEVSREQLLADVDAFRKEQDAKKTAAKPRFILEKGRSGFLTRGIGHKFNLKKTGNRATEISFFPSDDLLEFQPKQVSFLGTDESIDVTWKHSSGNGDSFIRIIFLDALGMQGEQILKFKIEDRMLYDKLSEASAD